MNAYELAEKLYLSSMDTYHEEAANMLRQQADRIAELENEVKRLVGAEPITHGKLTFCKNCGQQDPYAQTKPLSDEEIWEVWQEAKKTALSAGNSNPIEVVFAKAIEERHGIK